MTSDQRTSGSGWGYIEQRHLPQEGMDYDPSWMVRETYDLSTILVAQEGMVAMPTRRQAGMEPSTLS